MSEKMYYIQKPDTMSKTRIEFDLIKLEEKNFVVDPMTLCIHGFINPNHLDDLLENNTEILSELGEGMECNVPIETTIDVWEDSDDTQSWLDYEVVQQPIDQPRKTWDEIYDEWCLKNPDTSKARALMIFLKSKYKTPEEIG